MIETNIALCCLIGQLLIGLIALYRINGGIIIQDIRFFYLICFGLYTLFWPITNYIYNATTGDVNYIETLWVYNMSLLPFNLVILLKKTQWNDYTVLENKSFNKIITFYFSLILVLYAIYYIVSSGIPIFSFGAGMSDRKDYFGVISQIWIVLNLFIGTTFCILLYEFNNYSKVYKACIISLISIFTLFQLSMGNRREVYLYIIFFIILYLVKNCKKLNLKVSILFIFLFFGSFYVSLNRDSSVRDLSDKDKVEIAIRSNEFVYPMQTTYYTIRDNWDKRYGSTYLLLPLQILIPRNLYPEKPETLGHEFVKKTFGSGFMAFAYTPVTEAYLNGGYIGVFIVFLILALFLDNLVTKSNEGCSLKYILLLSLCLDWCRSDFSSFIYSLFMIWICISICSFMADKK